jgi:hypothetical protein
MLLVLRSLRAGLDGWAWREMSADAWLRAVERAERTWS